MFRSGLVYSLITSHHTTSLNITIIDSSHTKSKCVQICVLANNANIYLAWLECSLPKSRPYLVDSFCKLKYSFNPKEVLYAIFLHFTMIIAQPHYTAIIQLFHDFYSIIFLSFILGNSLLFLLPLSKEANIFKSCLCARKSFVCVCLWRSSSNQATTYTNSGHILFSNPLGLTIN